MSSPDSSPKSLSWKIGPFINGLLAPLLGVEIRRKKTSPSSGSPIATLCIGNHTIEMPSDNPIAEHYLKNPSYSSHLGRLASILHEKYPSLAVIDIGANIGDTACIIKSAADVRVMCIEGDEICFNFLQKNISKMQKATAHRLFLGEKTGVIHATLNKAGWNTTILPGETASSRALQVTSLDDFLAGKPDMENYKFLKIDTEGFDCAILRGAEKYLSSVLPVISFEYNRENMDKIGENGIDTLLMLAGLGYTRIVFHDSESRFICETDLNNRQLILDLHNYIDSKSRPTGIYYYDLTLFAAADGDASAKFTTKERNAFGNVP